MADARASVTGQVLALACAVLMVGTATCARRDRYAEPPAETYSVAEFELDTGSSTDTVRGAAVLPEFGPASRLRPHLGRYFLAADYESASQPVVFISYDLWRRRFNSAPSTIGTRLRLNGRNVTIVGVGPPGFAFPTDASVWVPAPRK